MAWLDDLRNYKKRRPDGKRLGAAIRACREATSEERLSAEARDAILSESLRARTTEEPLAAVFTPTRRLLVAGALPIALAVVLLVGIDGAVQTPPPALESAPRVAVVKQGDRVFFNIENGERPHVVYRSTDPANFERATGVAVTDGAYHEGLRDQADLVFYRID